MSSAPYFKLYFSDLAGDTLHLSDAEVGSYVLLIGAMWNAGGRLPLEQEGLARIARTTPKVWSKRWPRLARFFVVDDGQIAHKRVTAEREKVRGISAERSAAGAAGVEAKALKKLAGGQANASEKDKQTTENQASKQEAIPESIAIGDATASPGAAEGGGQAEEPAAPPVDEVRQAFDAWNKMANLCGLSLAERLTDGRRKAIRKRIEEAGYDGWRRALIAVAVSPVCRGKGERKWKADLDFVCQAKSFQRLLEGFYGTGETIPRAAKGDAAPAAVWAGPAHVREAVVAQLGPEFAASWLDPFCRWRDLPTPAVVTSRSFVADRLTRDARRVFEELGVLIVQEAAA